MRKTDSRDTSDRDLELLLTQALGRESRPGAAARRAAWRRLAEREHEAAADRALVPFAAGLVVLVATGAVALATGLVAGPFATVVTAVVVVNLAAVPISGLAIVFSRRHRYAEA